MVADLLPGVSKALLDRLAWRIALIRKTIRKAEAVVLWEPGYPSGALVDSGHGERYGRLLEDGELILVWAVPLGGLWQSST